jgi:hypothetical protein
LVAFIVLYNMHKGNKKYLPQKLCIVCNKPFTWRKKWEKNWNEIKYCSQKCRNNGSATIKI